jgi:hypothetical protein
MSTNSKYIWGEKRTGDPKIPKPEEVVLLACKQVIRPSSLFISSLLSSPRFGYFCLSLFLYLRQTQYQNKKKKKRRRTGNMSTNSKYIWGEKRTGDPKIWADGRQTEPG